MRRSWDPVLHTACYGSPYRVCLCARSILWFVSLKFAMKACSGRVAGIIVPGFEEGPSHEEHCCLSTPGRKAFSNVSRHRRDDNDCDDKAINPVWRQIVNAHLL